VSRWRAWAVGIATTGVAVAGVLLLLAVNAEVSGEESDEASPAPTAPAAAPSAVRSERISPPGARPAPPRPPTPLPRPRPEGGDALTPPNFRLGGIPPMGVTAAPQFEEGGQEDPELQKQLATRRLAALERRVRAMNRRVQNMGEHGSTPEQLESQKSRMDALLDEIRQKREEMGLGPFQMDDEQ
jgi:hypothetical protein